MEETIVPSEIAVEEKLFNHKTTDIDVWVPFNGLSFSDLYKVRTEDGREFPLGFESGTQWIAYTTLEPGSEPTTLAPEEVSEIALVPFDGPYRAFMRFEDQLARQRANIISNRKRLHPDEDLSVAVPELVRARTANIIYGITDKKTGEFKFHELPQQTFVSQFFLNEDGTWSTTVKLTQRIDGTTKSLAGHLASIKQFGAAVLIEIEGKVTVSDADVIARLIPESYDLKVIKQGRRKDVNWNEVVGKLPFAVDVRFVRQFKKETPDVAV